MGGLKRERDRVGRGEGFRNKGLGLKGFKQNRIQIKFEFQQPKEMLQHVCNHKLLYFIYFI
jgi:hypothetical protein